MLLLENKFWKIIQARQTCLSIQLRPVSWFIMVMEGYGYKTYALFGILSRVINWMVRRKRSGDEIKEPSGTCLCWLRTGGGWSRCSRSHPAPCEAEDNNTLEIFGAKVKNINIVTGPDNTFYKRPVAPPTWHRSMPKGQWPRISYRARGIITSRPTCTPGVMSVNVEGNIVIK